MRRALAILLLGAVMPGCDLAGVAAIGILSSRDRDDDDGGGGGSPPADPSYRVWVANLATPADATAQQSALSGGADPDPLVWSLVGSATATALFDPTAPAASINSVLVQGSNSVTYGGDSVEILSGSEVVLETATAGETYAGGVTSPAELAGAPDGSTATFTAALARPFAIVRTAGPIEKLRVTINSGTLASGDVEWVRTWEGASNAFPGGAAVNSSGVLHLSVSNWNAGGTARDITLVRYTSAGAALADTVIESGVTTSIGSHAVAIHSDNTVYWASTVDNDISVRKFDSSLGPVWAQLLDTIPADANRVEAHGLAVDAAGAAIVAGASDGGLSGLDHRAWKIPSGGGAPSTWTLGTPDTAGTYWRGVVANRDPAGSNDIFAVGDLTNTLGSTYIEDMTSRWTSGGARTWVELGGDNTPPADVAHAVELSGMGQPSSSGGLPEPLPVDEPDVVVAGSLGTSTQGRNGLLRKFSGSGAQLFLQTHNGPANGDDEILGVAVDPSDGAMYTVGYETVSGQGANLWVRRYDVEGNAVWTRTYHGGVGADRGVSVVLSGVSVYVIGQETIAGGEVRVMVRKYQK